MAGDNISEDDQMIDAGQGGQGRQNNDWRCFVAKGFDIPDPPYPTIGPDAPTR